MVNRGPLASISTSLARVPPDCPARTTQASSACQQRSALASSTVVTPPIIHMPRAWDRTACPSYNDPVTTSEKDHLDHHGPEHRDVSGGWLRPAVFGAMDGLVTNVSLIAGVGGGGGAQHIIVLTGLAGLAAGAFSMATGEYVSVSSQNELVESEVDKERHELASNAAAEQVELV